MTAAGPASGDSHADEGNPVIAAAIELLAGDIAAVLSAEPFGLSCDALAGRVHRRRTVVLGVLRDDPRFVHDGRSSRSRWSVAPVYGRGRERDGSGRVPYGFSDLDTLSALIGRVEALEAWRDEVERRIAKHAVVASVTPNGDGDAYRRRRGAA